MKGYIENLIVDNKVVRAYRNIKVDITKMKDIYRFVKTTNKLVEAKLYAQKSTL